MKNFVLLIVLYLSPLLLLGQTVLSDNSHIFYQGISPAYTGERGYNGFAIALGNQFNGTLRPNQISQVFNIDGRIGDSPSALGFTGYRSSFGAFALSGFALNYAYKIIKAENFEVNAGANLGFLVLPNFINSDFFQRFSTYGGAGFLFKGKRWFGSLSSPTLLSTTAARNFLGGNPIYVHAGYLFNLNDNIQIAPSVLALAGVNRWQAGSRFWIYDNLILGLFIKQNTDARIKLVPTFEYNLNGTSRFGISYDSMPQELSNVPNIQNFNAGIFQLFYRYDVEPNKNRELLNWF